MGTIEQFSFEMVANPSSIFIKQIFSPNFLYISFMDVNFENLTIEFHVFYVINIHIKFRLK